MSNAIIFVDERFVVKNYGISCLALIFNSSNPTMTILHAKNQLKVAICNESNTFLFCTLAAAVHRHCFMRATAQMLQMQLYNSAAQEQLIWKHESDNINLCFNAIGIQSHILQPQQCGCICVTVWMWQYKCILLHKCCGMFTAACTLHELARTVFRIDQALATSSPGFVLEMPLVHSNFTSGPF